MMVKVEDILKSSLVNDDTRVYIRDAEFNVITHGSWYQDNILNYLRRDAESFTWESGGRMLINLSPSRGKDA